MMSYPGCTLDVMSNYRFPDGVEFLGDGNGHARFKVSIPLDDDGFLGRECPSCNQHFRVVHDEYAALPEDLRLWCVYCGHHDDHSEFTTEQQRARVMRAAADYAKQLVGRSLEKSFGGAARRSRGSLVKITYRSKPFYPAPLPGIDEEKLVRERLCASCDLRYAVFGEHRFCPVCGLLTPLTAALDALAAETVRLDVLRDLPPDTHAALRESGVFDRTYVDTIENVVGVVESMAEQVFRGAVPSADVVLKGKGRVFQRLDDLADLFVAELGTDIRASLDGTWHELTDTWAARHVFTHSDGIVDAKYLSAVPHSSLKLGQRLRVGERFSRLAVDRADQLCRAIDAAVR